MDFPRSGPVAHKGRAKGVAQALELYAREPIADGRLVQLLPDWADERFPAYAYHRSRTLSAAKVRAFLDFVIALSQERAGG
jgi:DNA-binding transcriptional LysR family regulator